MQLLKNLGTLFGFRDKGLGNTFLDVLSSQRKALDALDDYAIYPAVSGNPAMRLYRQMTKEDSHLYGLMNRVSLSLLSAHIRITCEDKRAEEIIHKVLGYDPEQPTLRFRKLLNELSSSLQYLSLIHI